MIDFVPNNYLLYDMRNTIVVQISTNPISIQLDLLVWEDVLFYPRAPTQIVQNNII